MTRRAGEHKDQCSGLEYELRDDVCLQNGRYPTEGFWCDDDQNHGPQGAYYVDDRK